MIGLAEFARMIKDVHLGGIITGCYVTVEDSQAYVIAMDNTQAVVVETTAEFEHEDCSLGIEDLSLFDKYLNTIKDEEVSIKVTEENLVINPKQGAKVTYLLYDVDFIQSFDEEWGTDVINTEIEGGEYGEPLPVKQENVEDFLQMMGLFGHSSVFINVDKRGVVHLHGGKESDHQFDIVIGKIKGVEPFSLKVFGKNLASVLNRVDFSKSPLLYLAEKSSIIIKTETTSWMLRPVELEIDDTTN
jgi:hypothetical protein